MLEYKGYHAKIHFDDVDNIFVGEVFGISDSLNFHGSSINELTEMFHQSVDNYLDNCRKIGKAPEKEYKGSLNIRLSADLHRQAALEAARQGISLNQLISRSLASALASAPSESSVS